MYPRIGQNSYVRIAAVGLAAAALMQSPAFAGTCVVTEVIAKPNRHGDINNFSSQIPPQPFLSASNHYLLVDDYPESTNGFNINTGYSNFYATGVKTELYGIGPSPELSGGIQFGTCSIKAHMVADGPNPTVMQFLVKVGNNAVNVGPNVTVNPFNVAEYQRIVPSNPVTNAPWTSDDIINGAIQIGVRHDEGATGAPLDFADIAFVCL